MRRPAASASCVLARVTSIDALTPACCCATARPTSSAARAESAWRALTTACALAARAYANATFCALASITAERSAPAADAWLFAALTRPRFAKSNSVWVTRTRPSYASKGPMIFGMPGKERPCACVLKLRLNHPPESERFGNSPERVWRTRADAASVRKPAMTTDGGADCVFPVAWRTASANDKRSGAGACARNEPAKISANISAIGGLLADTMEIEIDVSVEVFGDVEAFGHTGRERSARDDRVHHGRHCQLGRNRHVHRPELAGFDTPLQHASHQAMTARDDFLVIEAG